MINPRLKYLITFVILLLIEIFIALFVSDEFIRPYVGDIIVVPVVYCFLRIIFPVKIKLLPLYTFIFAIFIELLQLVDILQYFSYLNNRFFNIILGSVFDFKDILCYFLGYLLILLTEFFLKSKKSITIKKDNL